MFCRNCGKEIDDRAVFCVNCGCAVKDELNRPDDVPSIGLNILSFVIPIVGLVLYAVHYKETPNKAKSMMTWAIVSMIIGACFYGCAVAMVI